MIAENTVPSPEMVGMITSVLVKTAPEREDSETRTVSRPDTSSSTFYSTVSNHWMVVVLCLNSPPESTIKCTYSLNSQMQRVYSALIEQSLVSHY